VYGYLSLNYHPRLPYHGWEIDSTREISPSSTTLEDPTLNVHIVYQNNQFNGLVFTVRARALNTLCSGFVQVFAAWILNLFTDCLPFKLRMRALVAAIYMFVMFNAVWIGGYFAMTRTKSGLTEAERLDVYDKGYGEWTFLFVMYGFMDARTIAMLIGSGGGRRNRGCSTARFLSRSSG